MHINRSLRKAGYIQVKDELGLETLDAGTSGAFAVADHQLAHVYVNKPEELAKVKKLLSALPGVEKVLDKQEQEAYRLNHDRSGDLVAVADKDSWFTYYYWLDDKVAPDYARTVDIHRKPGYDPVEMFANPDIKFLKGKLGWTLLKKKLGFRYLMDVIPLKAELVKGSHGRIPEDKADWPVLIGGKQAVENEDVAPTDVYSVIYGIVNRK